MNLIDILKKNNKIILSLSEEYFVKMQKKEKKYEYRKRFLNQKSYAFIYISKTKKKLQELLNLGYQSVIQVKILLNLQVKLVIVRMIILFHI